MSEVGKKWKKASVMSYRIGHSVLPNMQICHLKILRSQGWDDWMTSLTQWTWTGANSGRDCRTEEPGVLPSMGWWRVRHDLATEHTHKHPYNGLSDKREWTKTHDPVNLKRNMLSEKSQTEKHVLYMLHDFLEEAKQQAQKRDQWMPRSMCGRRGGLQGWQNHSTPWLIMVWLHDHAFVKTHRTDSTLLCEKCIRTGTQRVVTDFSQGMPCLLI